MVQQVLLELRELEQRLEQQVTLEVLGLTVQQVLQVMQVLEQRLEQQVTLEVLGLMVLQVQVL